MTILDIVLCVLCGLGFLTSLASVVVTNYAVQRMRVELNRGRATGDQLGWSDAVQKVAQQVIDAYRAVNPDGPLYRTLVAGYWMLGAGLVVGLGSAFALKFAD